MAFFPMFVDLTGQKCLVVGGGRIALRKVKVLLDFDAKVYVVARKISDEIKGLADSANGDERALFPEERKFVDSDVDDALMVVVATDDVAFNERVSALCRQKKIPVNVVDDKEKCSFIFSSYVKEKELVGAFTSGGNSPVLAKYLKDKAADILTPQLGDLNEVLGEQRAFILENFKDENTRKLVINRIIDETVSTGVVPSKQDIISICAPYKGN